MLAVVRLPIFFATFRFFPCKPVKTLPNTATTSALFFGTWAKWRSFAPSNSNIMKNTLLTLLLAATAATAIHAADSKIWYDNPAQRWEQEALPIGNGRLGAMVFGKTGIERIQFNEKSLWTGNETDTGSYQAFGDLFLAGV